MPSHTPFEATLGEIPGLLALGALVVDSETS